jgi:hypothetical protein
VTVDRRSRRPRAALTQAVAVAVVAVTMAGCSTSAGPVPAHTKMPVAPGLTAYVGPGDPAALVTAESAVGRRFTLASDYLDDRTWAGIDDDQWDLERWSGSDFRMVWGVPMLPEGGGVSLAAGAAGSYDGYFRTLAENLVAAGMGDSILRLGWEFNQKSYPWYAGGQPSAFVGYWRNIVTSMRSVPGQDFEFMWNPDRGDQGAGDAAVGNLVSYYPGDQYVDLVGLDVYDSAWKVYHGAAAEFHTVLTQRWGLDWLATFGSKVGRPLAIPELGLRLGPRPSTSGSADVANVVGGGDDPAFMLSALKWTRSHRVAETTLWDYGSSGALNGQNPQTEQTLRIYFATH